MIGFFILGLILHAAAMALSAVLRDHRQLNRVVNLLNKGANLMGGLVLLVPLVAAVGMAFVGGRSRSSVINSGWRKKKGQTRKQFEMLFRRPGSAARKGCAPAAGRVHSCRSVGTGRKGPL
jgi:hypothetical protein